MYSPVRQRAKDSETQVLSTKGLHLVQENRKLQKIAKGEGSKEEDRQGVDVKQSICRQCFVCNARQSGTVTVVGKDAV